MATVLYTLVYSSIYTYVVVVVYGKYGDKHFQQNNSFIYNLTDNGMLNTVRSKIGVAMIR